VADRKISDLTALTTPATGDLIPIVDISEAAAADKNKSITVGELLRGAPDGTAAAPGFSFESDDNTGIYRPGENLLAITTAGTERLRVDGGGRLLFGSTASRSVATVSSHVQVEGIAANDSSLSLIRNSESSAPARLLFAKSRGAALGSNTVVQDDDFLGEITFAGADGTDLLSVGASIVARVDGTPGSNDMPGRLVFSTTADGASSPTEAFAIRQSGLLESDPTYASTTANAANVNISSTGFFARSTSSGKYKTSVETLEDSYADAILNCRPVWYRSTCQHDNPDHGWWGFIAEEVALIDPRLVHWKTVEVSHDENGKAIKTPCDPEPEGVAYDRFVPHLLNLIKRQGEAIAELQTEVAALKAS
jgi:hypothetical protein